MTRMRPSPVTAVSVLSAAGLLILASCGPAPGIAGGGRPPGASPMGLPSSRDPVGFLLQNRDSIGINDSVTQELVRLNLRLFRRNREVQLHLDSILFNVPIDRRAELQGDSSRSQLPADVRERAAPYQAQIAMQTAAVKDTAWAMLTENQRNIAAAIELRMQEMSRRGSRPMMGSGRP